MWFPLYLQCTWWLVSNKKAMFKYDDSSMQGWLEEATLFPAEPHNYGFNFDEILTGEKTSYEADLVTGLPDLDWLDAHTDISVLDESKEFQPFDIEDPLNLGDAANLLLDLIENSNLDASYLSSDMAKNDLDTIFNLSTTPIEELTVSPEVPSAMSSPFYDSISEASSPASIEPEVLIPDSISEASSPASIEPEMLISDVCSSPASSGIDDGGYESSEALPTIKVTVCDMDVSSGPSLQEALNIEEVVRSVRKRRYVSDGIKDIPKVTLKNVFHPYSRAASSSSKRSGGKKERKKVQNKEAAARYRVKKRIEEKELSGEVGCLEREQAGLRKKHDDLVSEIKYLKNLMREVLQKKGIM